VNKPFYKSTGVMGAGASIVGCLVALVASLASLKGLEITPENQALIVSLVMTLGGSVAALIGRLKASDVMFSDVLVSEMSSERGCSFSRSLTGIKQGPYPEFGGSLPGVEPDTPWERPVPAKSSPSAVEPVRPFPGPPEDDACPSCRTRFGAHVLGCSESCAAPAQKVEPQLEVVSGVLAPPVDLHAVLTRLADAVETLNAKSAPGVQPFVKDQAGFPGPVAEVHLVGESGPVITNG
jgi:hypothetical protein